MFNLIIWTIFFISILPPEPSSEVNYVNCSTSVNFANLPNNTTFGNFQANHSYTIDNNEWLQMVTDVKPGDPVILNVHQLQQENVILATMLIKNGKFSRVLLERNYRDRKKVKIIYILILVSMILLCGDVETNPGPTQVNIGIYQNPREASSRRGYS